MRLQGEISVTGTTEFAGRFYADGRASGPRELGWTRGAPPDADQLITFESHRFLDFPEIRWSLSHMRVLTATANIWRGPVSPSHLPIMIDPQRSTPFPLSTARVNVEILSMR